MKGNGRPKSTYRAAKKEQKKLLKKLQRHMEKAPLGIVHTPYNVLMNYPSLSIPPLRPSHERVSSKSPLAHEEKPVQEINPPVSATPPAPALPKVKLSETSLEMIKEVKAKPFGLRRI